VSSCRSQLTAEKSLSKDQSNHLPLLKVPVAVHAPAASALWWRVGDCQTVAVLCPPWSLVCLWHWQRIVDRFYRSVESRDEYCINNKAERLEMPRPRAGLRLPPARPAYALR
jgi:hypothetical protein